ncbi:MAG: tetratricopeptide repeat protein [Bacteroides sp.]
MSGLKQRYFTWQWMCLLLLCLSWMQGLHAQVAPRAEGLLSQYERGMALFRAARYASAEELFSKISAQSPQKGDPQGLYAEAAYFKALCVIRLGRGDAPYELLSFMEKYPASLRVEQAKYELGSWYYNAKKYKDALRWFATIDEHAFDEEGRAEVTFKHAYSLFQLGRLDEALPIFARVKDESSYYQAPATYYYAHISYTKGHYSAALDHFRRIDADPSFAPLVPYYIAQILYKQEQYRELATYVRPLVDSVVSSRQSEMQRMLGEAYFRLEKFDSAHTVLTQYAERVGKNRLTRDDNYLVGLVYYKRSAWADAAKYLERVPTESDSVTQNAYYHLGDIYLHLGDIERAQKALGQASELTFDVRLQEDALFNYAKLLYEHRYNPFADAVSAFTRYLTLFPKSKRRDEAYTYLGMAFMGTQNYQGALDALSKIGTANATTRRAYQRAAYYRGVEYYQNLRYGGADSLFAKSLELSDLDNMLRAKALYWRAETNYRLERYALSAMLYQQFLNAPGAFSQPQYKKVPYDLGYTYFKLKDYDQAVAWLRLFTEKMQRDSLGLLTDALVRIGDCLYIQRKYWPAIDYYLRASEVGGLGADYALYQQGCVLGLVSRPEKKIATLASMGERYPKSPYRSNAYFEIAETYHLLDNLPEASKYYWQVVNEFPSSVNAPSALLQIGLVNYEQDEYEAAIKHLKRVVHDYPGTPSMHEALSALERVYKAQGDVKPYLAYLNEIGQENRVSQGRRDSLFYTTAEAQYMGGQYGRARMSLEEYLREFPEGAGSVAANYYLADCLLRASDSVSALPRLEVVIRRQPNEFYDKALAKACPIYEQRKDFRLALEGYEALERVTGDPRLLQEARYSKLRMVVVLGEESRIVEYANAVLSDERTAPERQLFARYQLGLALLRAERYDQAYNVFALIGSNTGAATGAEARFRMAEIRAKQNDWGKLQEEVFAFAKRNTPHQYWLAKSFLLLAEGYRTHDDLFQARATLQSIAANYEAKEDGILTEVNAALARIAAEEKARERVIPTDTIQFRFAQ